jgi:hypothetical protein
LDRCRPCAGRRTGSNGPQNWTFDQAVSVEFGIAGLSTPSECIEIPVGVEPVTIAPSHSWDPDSRLICGNLPINHAATSVFASTAPVAGPTLSHWQPPRFTDMDMTPYGVGFVDKTIPLGLAPRLWWHDGHLEQLPSADAHYEPHPPD